MKVTGWSTVKEVLNDLHPGSDEKPQRVSAD